MSNVLGYEQQPFMSMAVASSIASAKSSGGADGKPTLSLHEQEPLDWSMLQLHWRDKYLKNDDDREQWLFDKFKGEITKYIKDPHPHHPATRKVLVNHILSSQVKSKWTYGRRLQWLLSCCGLAHRWWPVANERMWTIILVVYVTLWMGFCLTALQRTYGTNGDDPISWDEFIEKFVHTLYATLAWTLFTFIVYELPRVYNHCFKCRLVPEDGKAFRRITDRVLCIPGGSVMCCLSTRKSRLRRSRLEKCIRFDRTLDDEAATYSYLYDSDVDDPDIFLYYHHTRPVHQSSERDDIERGHNLVNANDTTNQKRQTQPQQQQQYYMNGYADGDVSIVGGGDGDYTEEEVDVAQNRQSHGYATGTKYPLGIGDMGRRHTRRHKERRRAFVSDDNHD